MSRRTKRPWKAARAAAASLTPIQAVVNAAPEAWGKKLIIMSCREAGAITGESATLLLQAYQLETA